MPFSKKLKDRQTESLQIAALLPRYLRWLSVRGQSWELRPQPRSPMGVAGNPSLEPSPVHHQEAGVEQNWDSHPDTDTGANDSAAALNTHPRYTL